MTTAIEKVTTEAINAAVQAPSPHTTRGSSPAACQWAAL
jgi:hypothetical protein